MKNLKEEDNRSRGKREQNHMDRIKRASMCFRVQKEGITKIQS